MPWHDKEDHQGSQRTLLCPGKRHGNCQLQIASTAADRSQDSRLTSPLLRRANINTSFWLALRVAYAYLTGHSTDSAIKGTQLKPTKEQKAKHTGGQAGLVCVSVVWPINRDQPVGRRGGSIPVTNLIRVIPFLLPVDQKSTDPIKIHPYSGSNCRVRGEKTNANKKHGSQTPDCTCGVADDLSSSQEAERTR